MVSRRGLGAVAFLLLLSSCDFDLINWVGKQVGLPDDYFPEYLDKNLLDNYDFTAGVLEGSPKWALAPTTTSDYMTWEVPTEAGVPKVYIDPATLAESPVYRLEIKNLLPNGDFEEETDGATTFARPLFWKLLQEGTIPNRLTFNTEFTTLGSITLPTLTADDPKRQLNHRAFWWDSNAGGNRLQLELDTALGTLWVPGSYQFRMDLINTTSGTSFNLYLMADSTTLLTDNTGAEKTGTWTVQTPTDTKKVLVNQISQNFTLDANVPSRLVNFGNPSVDGTAAFQGIIDNVRLIRADQESWVKAEFASLTSGSLKLLPGSQPGAYTFHLLVRDDDTADQSSSQPSGATHAPNRFYPQGLFVRLTAKVNSQTASYTMFFARPDAGWPNWEPLKMSLGFDFVTSDADLAGEPALRMELSPTNMIDQSSQGRDAGSLLLARPQLVFHSLP